MKKKYLIPLIIILLIFVIRGYCIDYTSQYPPEQSGTYVKATTETGDINYRPFFATDPTLSLTGSWLDNSWVSGGYEVTEQRFHIDLGSAKIIRRIYYENGHSGGKNTNVGVENFTFWGSNTAGSFDDLVYANDEEWTQIATSVAYFDEHSATDEADPKYITVTNTTAYRYYALKFADNHGSIYNMGVRRIELQTEDGYTPPSEDNAIFWFNF